MATKTTTTTKIRPPVAAKVATNSPTKEKAASITPALKAALVVAPKERAVLLEPTKATGKAKRVVKKADPKIPSYAPDDVALRAYFISEERRSLSLPGDEHQDWLEAERQISAESALGKKAIRA